MKAILITRFGLKPDNITVMMEKPDSEKLPTKKNIQDQLTRMIPYEALLAHVSALTGLDTPNIGDHMIHLRVPCSRCRPIGTLSRWNQTRGFYWVPARRMSCLMKMSMIRANPFTKIVGEIIAKKGRARPTNREIVVLWEAGTMLRSILVSSAPWKTLMRLFWANQLLQRIIDA